MRLGQLSLTVLMTFGLAITFTDVAAAQQGPWEKLGSRKVSFGGEKDAIPVTAAEGRFSAIKLQVENGNLEMYNIRVTFGDGSHFSPDTRLVFQENSRSRTIDLPGNARVIKKVEFWYRSKIRQGRATVNLYGRHGKEAAAPRWEKLGSRQVAFRGEKDTIMVTGQEGRFNAIKIDIDNGTMEMFNIKVTFGDGSSFSPDTRWKFTEDSRSRTIDLPGNARIIRKVEFWYRSTIRDGRATLSLYGRHPGADTPATPVPAAPRWEKLGSRQVAFRGEKDTIMVTGQEGRFTAIKLDIDKGNLDMYNIRVTFGNGETWSPETRVEFNQGSRSRTLDLPGEARIIRKVEFWYRSELKRGKATLNLWGRHPG